MVTGGRLRGVLTRAVFNVTEPLRMFDRHSIVSSPPSSPDPKMAAATANRLWRQYVGVAAPGLRGPHRVPVHPRGLAPPAGDCGATAPPKPCSCVVLAWTR